MIKTLSLVKHLVDYSKNLKNLLKAGKEDLKKTLAFLLASNESDERITQYKVDGMRIALMETLITLMPKFCTNCKDDSPYFAMPGDRPEVQCIRCNVPACPKCFKKEDSGGWSYVCDGCIVIVRSQQELNLSMTK